MGEAVFGVGVVLVVGLCVAVLTMLRSTHRRIDGLQDEVLELRTELAGGIDGLDHALSRVSAQADRLAAAAGLPPIDERPRPVTRVPKMLRSKSVVKAMALGTGTAHAARRLRHGATNGNGNGTAR